jgi:hypothetical protein
VRPVVGPFARRGDPFAGRNDGGVPDDGPQIAVAARFRPKNAEAVLGIVEGASLDQAGEALLSRRFGRWPHALAKIAGFFSARHSEDAARPA